MLNISTAGNCRLIACLSFLPSAHIPSRYPIATANPHDVKILRAANLMLQVRQQKLSAPNAAWKEQHFLRELTCSIFMTIMRSSIHMVVYEESGRSCFR